MKIDYDRHLDNQVTIFLTNGVKLTGTVKVIEPLSLWLVRDGMGQSVLKHAIATIMEQPQEGNR